MCSATNHPDPEDAWDAMQTRIQELELRNEYLTESVARLQRENLRLSLAKEASHAPD